MIKKGDKVICINDGPYAVNTPGHHDSYLTLYKEYKVISIFQDRAIEVICDNGIYLSYNISRFISIAEWREKQIKSVIDGE